MLLLIAALFGLIFWNLRAFVPALLGAYTLYVLLRGPMHFLTERLHWHIKLAASAVMLASFAVILVPVNVLVRSLGSQLGDSLQHSHEILQSIETSIVAAEQRLGFPLLTPERIKSMAEWGAGEVSGILNATLFGTLLLLITYFILWFMLTAGKRMETNFFNWLPLKPDNIEYLRKELNDLVFSNALGIPLMGIVQGLAGLLGYWLAGVDDLWFWVLMTCIAGMMPFLGVSLAFIPLSLVMLSKGMAGQAAFIFVYGFFVIGSVDNFARMWLLNKIGHTHPLITLFGVIIGLNLFGFVGFVFGPIMIAMFLLLVKIYGKEFR